MQVYALRFYNFFRFSEKNNSVVFDISPEDRSLLDSGKITIDDIYDKVLENPVNYIKGVKDRGLNSLIGIAGVMGDNYDLSNGCGKSTLLEGICYAHYEQIVRKNVNTDKVATAGLSVVTKINGKYPPKMKESWVEEIFEEAGKVYRIKRGRTFTSTQQSSSPILEFVCYNESEEDSQAGHRKADTNESIAKVTAMDYDLFVNSVLFGQSDVGKFLTGTDKTRKEMLVNLLRLEDIISGCLENIRKRKNTKEKDITSLNAKIDIIDSAIKSKPTIESIEVNISLANNKIKKIEEDISLSNEKIEKLSKSDVIKILEGIKEEGKKIKESLISQKEARESQIKEWVNLYNDAETKEKSQLIKMQDIEKKNKDIQSQIENISKLVAQFDVSIREEELKKVEKAKEFKPKLVELIQKNQSEKEKNLSLISSEQSELKRLTKENDLLNNQISSVNSEEFVCDKCKSKVAKKHILDEIDKNKSQISKHQETIKEIETNQKTVVEKLTNAQKNLDKANEYLIKENKIRLEIKENENNKTKIEELKKLQKEDYSKAYSDLKEEYQSIKKQKEDYVAKKNEIANKYDSSIKKIQEELDGLAEKYTAAKKDAENIENNIKSIKSSITSWTNEKSSLDSQIGSFKKEIDTIKKDKTALDSLQKQSVQEVEALNRLVMLDDIFGLEGIQTRIIKKYLPLLNNYIKEILDVLTNGEMRVRVYINDKSKVDISIEGGSSDSFTLLSGGEKTLCRLGISIGLALLSFTRCASKPELICLDEIFSALDVAHEESVFRLIKKLQDKFSRILIISHRASINDRIKNKILVEKDTGIFGMSKIKEIT